ncbi:MAG: tRNA epoxyqueuosine(34) reductase QueG [Chloroflexota bacterium]
MPGSNHCIAEEATTPGAEWDEDALKAHATSLGFDRVGITTAEPFPEAEQRTLAWLADGKQADMAWMTQERAYRAAHPSELLPDARAIVAVAASYGGPAPSPPTHSGYGQVARYARGTDYHEVLHSRLRALAAAIESGWPGSRTRLFVDSSPLVERAAAVRAGLGFIGKNSNLLTREAGSWVLLGAILTSAPLRPDPPVSADCGRCTLCIDACPTGAIPEPFVLDSNRCISYLTIEHRGSIDPELRSQMGNHVFGCDVCQDVCPWNRSSRHTSWTELVGPPERAYPSLAHLLTLGVDDFRAAFRYTPLWRAKRRGLARNAAIALGNSGGKDAVTPLISALDHDEALVRGHAAWALGRIGGEQARTAIERRLAIEDDADAQLEMRAALQTSAY